MDGWLHLRCGGIPKDQWTNSWVAPCCAARPPPPAPIIQAIPIPAPPPPSFKILQFNINGLTPKLPELLHYMTENSILVGAIQETKLTAASKFSANDLGEFTLVRKDRSGKLGGGLAFLVHKSVQFSVAPLRERPPPDDMEQQAIKVTSGDSTITLVNYYIPPQSSCATGYVASLEHILDLPDGIIMGDANGHHDLWHSAIASDTRGNNLADEIGLSSYAPINTHHHTRQSGNTFSSPDITLASASLLPTVEWSVETALSSDHLPITIDLQRAVIKTTSAKRVYVNFAKANWAGFKDHCERAFSQLQPPDDPRQGEKVFRTIVVGAGKRFIPAGRIAEIRPNFPTEAARLADERDQIRAQIPDDPRLPVLNTDINKLVKEHKQKKWDEHLSGCNLGGGLKRLWSTVKSLSNPKQSVDNVAIKFGGRDVTDPKLCARLFNSQFTPDARNLGTEKARRPLIRKIKALNSDRMEFDPVTVAEAIKATKASKAMGPDGISPIMLKNLGVCAIKYLTGVINCSISKVLIPPIWKVGRIIPLPKPGKPENEATSYRPISILSPVAKLAESLILPTMKAHLLPAAHQHGFRKLHSTTTALHAIHHQVTTGLNQKKPASRTLMVAIDLSKAFDCVNHDILIEDLHQSTLPGGIKRWVSAYLRGRQTYVEFRDAKSTCRKMRQGVPQGGVLSPLLFNTYLAKLPEPPQGINIVSYADDCTVLTSGPHIDKLCQAANGYLKTLKDWFTSRNLQLSATKSSATLFTSWSAEANVDLDVSIDGARIPTVKNPKVLGVTFDPMLSFAKHVELTKSKVKSRNNVLKSLAGSTWGMDKEVLATTYKAIGRPVLNYAAPIWAPGLSDTRWNDLQIAQNDALRTAIGCHKMASVDHLHQETKILPVKAHGELLSRQYLLRCHIPDHPNHRLVLGPEPPRHIRKNLTRRYQTDIAPHLPPGGLSLDSYKRGLAALHRKAVDDAIAEHAESIVLGGYPPPIAAEERDLPREARCILSQFRSGYSRHLNSYMSRIDPHVPNICPKCAQGPHDVAHVFNCAADPTQLTVADLWSKPKEVAAFLGLEI